MKSMEWVFYLMTCVAFKLTVTYLPAPTSPIPFSSHAFRASLSYCNGMP